MEIFCRGDGFDAALTPFLMICEASFDDAVAMWHEDLVLLSTSMGQGLCRCYG